MGSLFMATSLNWVGKIIYNSLYQWVSTWGAGSKLISVFAITVIMFSIFLKLITLPLDIWQKVLTRNNAKKMEIMKPALDKIQEQCGDNKEAQMKKQRELYKKHKYSTFAACLPSIVTMVIFFIVLSGFNSAVKHHNSAEYDKLAVVYNREFKAEFEKEKAASGDAEDAKDKAIKAAEAAVVLAYKPENFLLTKNIFMPDTWKSPVPDKYTYMGTGLGKLGIKGGDADEYDKVMKPLIEKFNYTSAGKKVWNGFMILPILSILLNFLSSFLIKQPEQPSMPGQSADQQKMQKSQSKMMQFMMPVMMGIFSLLYSTAFTLYMIISAAMGLLLNLVFVVITKAIDKKQKDHEMSVTIK